MSFVPEQFSAATKASFDAQLALMTSLTGKAFEGVEKFVELNLAVAKTTFEESNAAAKQLLSAKDPQEFFALTSAQAQPNAEKVLSYGRHVSGIFSTAQAEFTRAAEAQIAETNKKVIALVDEVSKNAPAGSENLVAMVKTTLGNASSGYEQMTKTTKQAMETMEANMTSVVGKMTQAAAKATPRAANR